MEDDCSGDVNVKKLAKHRRRSGGRKNTGFHDRRENGEEDDGAGQRCDGEVWDALSKSFNQVQSVLDQNKALIQQVNENHQSKIPDNLAKNVALIDEISGNISKVASLYSDLSVNFSGLVNQRRATLKIDSNNGNGNSRSSAVPKENVDR